MAKLVLSIHIFLYPYLANLWLHCVVSHPQRITPPWFIMGGEELGEFGAHRAIAAHAVRAFPAEERPDDALGLTGQKREGLAREFSLRVDEAALEKGDRRVRRLLVEVEGHVPSRP
jgi:hypothetical protein